MDAIQHPERSRRLITAAVAVAGSIAAIALTAAILGDRELMASTVGRATPLLILAAVAFGAVAVRFSSIGLPLLVVFVYLNLSQALVRYHDFPSLLQVLVVGLAFAAWLKQDTDAVAEVLRQPLSIALTGYVFLLLVTTAIAKDQGVADERLVEMVKSLVIFGLATLLMRNRKRMIQGLFALAGAATFLGVLALVQVMTGDFSNELAGLARIKQAHIYGRVFQPRIAGPLGDPNFFSQILLLVLPIPVLFGARTSTRTARIMWFSSAGIILATVLLTYSRGAMVALAVMGVMVLKTLHISWRTTLVILAAFAASLVLLPESVTKRFLTIEQIIPTRDAPLRLDSSFEERKLYMRVAWVMFGANPIIGVGAGNYTAEYDDYVDLTGSAARQYEDQSALYYPHNLYLEVAAESGLIGLAILVAIVFAAWSASGEALRPNAGPWLKTAAQAFRIALVGYLVSGLFLHLAFPRYLFLIVAFAATMQRLSRRAEA